MFNWSDRELADGEPGPVDAQSQNRPHTWYSALPSKKEAGAQNSQTEPRDRARYSYRCRENTPASKHSLQEDEIEPTVEFETHLAEMGDTNESQTLVKG